LGLVDPTVAVVFVEGKARCRCRIPPFDRVSGSAGLHHRNVGTVCYDLRRGSHDMDVDDEDQRMLLEEVIRVSNLVELRGHVLRLARRAGLDEQRAADFAVAVNETAVNVIRHAGGDGELDVVQDDERRLVAEVRDNGPGIPAWVTLTLPSPDATSGRGLWMAGELTDHIEVRTGRRGTTVRLEMVIQES
jgi:anti-sigma regulatory factor (Ser/Thr protein kinase)